MFYDLRHYSHCIHCFIYLCWPRPYPLDRTVKIYDVNGNSYTHTATLEGHTGPVWSVAWSHPKFGVVLASCSFDGSVLIHRETRPREWTKLHHAKNLHQSSVNSVDFCPHEFGLVIAAASSDGKVSILTHGENDAWNVEYITDNALGVNAVSFAPYTAYIESETATSAEDADTQKSTASMHLVTGGCDNGIRFWNKSSVSNKWEIDASPISSEVSHSDWVRDVAWAPSVVPNTNVVASCSEDRTVIVWTQVGGSGNSWEPKLLHKFEDPVWRVSWSVTGSILAVSSGDNSVTLWKQTLEGDWKQVSSVQESENGQQKS
jgi:protein transport protein SEC13